MIRVELVLEIKMMFLNMKRRDQLTYRAVSSNDVFQLIPNTTDKSTDIMAMRYMPPECKSMLNMNRFIPDLNLTVLTIERLEQLYICLKQQLLETA